MSTSKGNIVIFDIDGTLADARHRVHLVQTPKDSGKRQWGKFFAEAKNDQPYLHIKLLNQMFGEDPDVEVYLITGRPDNLREDTWAWIIKHNIFCDHLLMRPAKDHRPDYEAKKDLFEKHPILSQNKDKVICVFEDRLKVAKMWRDIGLNVCVCGEDWLAGDWSE